MNREIKYDDGRIYIKCCRCWIFKEANGDNFYKSKNLSLGLIWCCKECKKKELYIYAKTNKDKILERTRNYRKQYSLKYRKDKLDKLVEYNKEYRRKHLINVGWKYLTYWGMLNKITIIINNLWIRPNRCPICWAEWKTQAHHPDYNKWDEIVFVCRKCHKRIHSWDIKCPTPIKLVCE